MNENNKIEDTVFFGKYPQGGRGEIMPIEWIVLDRKEDRALLLSKYILDMQTFAWPDTKNFWGFCRLHDWLKNWFMNRAFSPDETARIIQPVELEYSDNDVFLWEFFNMDDVTNSMRDPVFLLSAADAELYFPGSEEGFLTGASAEPTEWVKKEYPDDMNEFGISYWLRSASAESGFVYIVSPADSIGAALNSHKIRQGVRPALWIKL